MDVNGINKLAGEWYHIVYNHAYGVRATVLRLTNTYGPRQLMKHNRQGFLPWFIRQVLDDEEIQLFGDGRQRRDFTYVDDAVEAFLLAGWVEAMLACRPFQSDVDLLAAAGKCFVPLNRSDWLEAFAAHPRIGDLDALRRKFPANAGEQAGVAGADESVLRDLAEANRQYEVRFGYIFIVCASGKSAAEMLANLQSRLDNDPEAELEIAAAEQRGITWMRLEKL